MINGRHFIQYAGKLAAASQPDEVVCRTVVSRAYYGAFHLALALFDELGVSVPANANAHSIVQRYLIGSGHADAQQAGMTLASLHSDRIRADYRLADFRFEDPRFARLKVALAHDVASALDACRNDQAKATVKAGIEAYRDRITESR